MRLGSHVYVRMWYAYGINVIVIITYQSTQATPLSYALSLTAADFKVENGVVTKKLRNRVKWGS